MSRGSSHDDSKSEQAVARHLPLKPISYLLLVALQRGERYGYTLQREVEELSEGTVRLDPGTLYRWLARLLDGGLVERVEAPDDEVEDPRRRYYRSSSLGVAVVEAESRRLGRLILHARDAGTAGEAGR
ncbi:MAG TPA: PadR family transcriptional regulator [Thermoanaerobaculia bacterium]|nr:PadR family transcriptional regulator [Thermoanaerobaculia bacterium]